MFDTIKEWLNGLFGGAAEEVTQQVEELNPQDKVEEFTQNATDQAQNLGEEAQNVGEQVGQNANDLKDNFPK